MKHLMYTLLFLLAGNGVMLAQQDETPVKDPAKLSAGIAAFSAVTSTISADFMQVKEMSFMEEKVVSSGKFYFQKEHLMRWEYTEPFSYAIILSGDRVRIIDEGKIKDFEAGANRMFMEISRVMTGLVNGSLPGSDQFRTSWFESPDAFRAELIPVSQAMQAYLARIELSLNKRDYSVEALKMYEKSGDYTEIIFKNKQLNETIPAGIFRLD